MKELARDGIPVTVTCRVLKLARQPYYRWLERPVTDAEFEQAARANALFDAHREDPEFGYRFLADEARSMGNSSVRPATPQGQLSCRKTSSARPPGAPGGKDSYVNDASRQEKRVKSGCGRAAWPFPELRRSGQQDP
ncbi:hypothetical protein [Streptomyces sp. NPDC007074]|uniref:hypothetical protein n=1 Tax=Streptomyces sp. NPDC007074 TaxID=3156764 RepID=UPI0033D9530D